MTTRLLTYSLLMLILALAILFAGQIVADGSRNHALQADYTGFLLGGALFAQGHAAAGELYSIPVQTLVQQGILAGSNVQFADGLLPFVNPPYVAILAMPLYYLSPEWGFVLWDSVQIAALLLALWLLQAMLPSQYRYLLWLGAFAYLPLYQSLVQAQVSPTLLLGITLLWRCLRGGNNWGAGASLTLLLLKPQLLPLYLLYLLWRRNWQALAGFSLLSAAIYGISALTSGWSWPFAYFDLLNWLGNHPNHYGSTPQLMFTWRGLFARFDLANALPLAFLTVATAFVLIYAWWRSDHLPTNDRGTRIGKLELQLAATTVAATLDGFYLYTHDLTMLIFSGVVLLGWAAEHGWPAWTTGLLLAALITPFTFFANIRDALGPPLDTSFIVVMVIAFATLIYHLLQVPGPVREGGIR